MGFLVEITIEGKFNGEKMMSIWQGREEEGNGDVVGLIAEEGKEEASKAMSALKKIALIPNWNRCEFDCSNLIKVYWVFCIVFIRTIAHYKECNK